MPVKLILRSILLFVVTFLMFSCSSEKKIVEQKKIIPAERLIVKLEANRRKIKYFSAQGNVTVNSPQINSKFSFTVDYKKPDSLKLTAFGPFGMDIAALLLTQDFFNYYDAVANVLYQGENKDKIVSKIFKVPVSSNELVNLIIGKADFENVLRKEPEKYELKNGKYFFRFHQGDLTREFTVSADNFLLENYKIISATKGIIFSVTYSNFKNVKGLRELFPFRIYVESPKNKANFEIKYSKVKINSKLNDLRLLIPGDVKIKKF